MMKTLVYVIGMPTGQKDAEGVDIIILVDVKLTRLAAEQVQRSNPGSTIQKRFADKLAP